MWRKRWRWPPHLLHAPQSSQAPQRQSTGRQAPHSCSWQAVISTRSASQVRPPFWPSCSTRRRRVRCPRPQSTSQAVHALQAPSLQSTTGLLQPSPSHGQVCFKAPSQARPSPRRRAAIVRERLLTPVQRLVQSLQAIQGLNAQSLLARHATPALQPACSMESPTAARPQSLASLRSFRERHVAPPLQVLEQGSQRLHGPHSPSTQGAPWHGWVLHGWISSLLPKAHNAPPPLGAWRMCRILLLWPPLQEQVQPPQSDQSPHRQSTLLQTGWALLPGD
mmetsp:Transcript_20863/g.64411  ORF Transcript_20863/g.64411 Transcript_20863/m.64411 type:complete len:278 (+) Transcript_20863:519-1352(+)